MYALTQPTQQQKQLRAAMNMELPLSRAECALAVSHHNGKRRQMSSLVGRGREQMVGDPFSLLRVFRSNTTECMYVCIHSS